MNFGEIIGISEGKIEDLKNRIKRLQIDLNQVEETFVRGGGKGGQKVNKTSNAVVLKYPPLNLGVKAHQNRQRSINRFLALRELVDQIELKISPKTSRRAKEWNKIRKQKDRRKRRTNEV